MRKTIFTLLTFVIVVLSTLNVYSQCGDGGSGTACGNTNSGDAISTVTTVNSVAINTWQTLSTTSTGQPRWEFTDVLKGTVLQFANCTGQDSELTISNPEGVVMQRDADNELNVGLGCSPNGNDESFSYYCSSNGTYRVRMSRHGSCSNMNAGTKYLYWRVLFRPCAVTPTYGSGVWNGYVYDGTGPDHLYGSIGTQAWNDINVNWGTGQPISSGSCGVMCDADNFSTTWYMNRTYSRAWYVFSTPGNDDGRVLSNDGGANWNIINDWTSNAGTSTSGSVFMDGNYNMVFFQRENSGGAAARLTTCQMDGNYTFGANTWNYYIFDDRDIEFNKYQGWNTQSSLNFNLDWGAGQPAYNGGQRCGRTMDDNYFSVRFMRNHNFANGTYSVRIITDDGARVSSNGGSSWNIYNSYDDNIKNVTIDNITLNGSTNLMFDVREREGSARASINFCKVPANPTGITANPASICTGSTQNVTFTATGIEGDVYWYTGSCGGTYVGTGNSITVAVSGPVTYYARNRNYTDAGGGNTLERFSPGCASITYTPVAQPVAPTLTKSAGVNVASVCAGTNVSATYSGGSGGVGCSNVHQYRTRNTSNVWSSWMAYTSGSNIATTTSMNRVEIRTAREDCTAGVGCTAAENTVAWDVTPVPVAPTVTKSPNLTNVCSGTNVSASFGTGSGGVGCTDSYEFRRRTGVSSWSAWAAYTPSSNISTSGFTEVQVKSIRGNCSANTGCSNVENIVSWLIDATPVAPTATLSPNVNLVCQGQNVSATFTAGSLGVGCADVFQFRTRNLSNVWSSWATYTGGNNISTTNTNRVEIRAARENCTSGAGCTGVENIYAWDVQPDPSVSIASIGSTICTGNNIVGIEASILNSLGTPTYIWEQSPDGITWSAASGATNSNTYQSPTITAQTYFRLKVAFGNLANLNCDTAISNVINIQLPAAPSTPDTLGGCGLATLTVTPGLGADAARFYNAQPPLGFIPGADGTSYSATGSQTIWVRSLNTTTGCLSNGYDSTFMNISPLTFSYITNQSNYNGFSVSCSGGNNGTASIAPDTGGVAPFTYLWNTGANTSSISGLSAGTYTVTITDANGCAAAQSYIITQPSALSLFGSDVGPKVGSFTLGCNGNTNGTITLNVTGGSGGNTYNWGGGVTTQNRSGLGAGNYTVTVTNNNGCSISQTFSITQPSPIDLNYNIGYICDVNTNQYISAVLSATGDGGVQPYQYRLNAHPSISNYTSYATNNTNSLFNGLTNGYSGTVYVRDVNGCEKSLPYSITFPANGTAVDACDVIYVSPTGGGTFGSRDCPTSIENAFTIYTNEPQRNRIIMLVGDYNLTSITIPTVNPSYPLIIDGGYEVVSGGEWRKNITLPTKTKFNLSPTEQNIATDVRIKRGFIAENKSNFTVQDVTIDVSGYAVDDRINGHGKSVYGVYLNGCSNYKFIRTTVTTGDASSGLDGASGGNGSDGGSGTQGTGQNCGCDVCAFSPNCGTSSGGAGATTGGAGGIGANAGGAGGNGGNGGAASIPNDNCPAKSANGGTGLAGATAPSGGGAGGTGAGNLGVGGDSFCGCDGTAASGGTGVDGAAGTPGSAGTDATVAVYDANGYWIPQQGISDGLGGGGGQGGGGGGGGGSTSQRGPACTGGGCDFLGLGFRDASRAPAGSGGGKGGGGGGGGYRGKGGGSAYGFFIWNNGPNSFIIDCFSNPGAAGAKGNGGAGGAGGAGGNGGGQLNANCSNPNKPGAGGAGGKGGNGGAGGKGGDGLAGERVLIYQSTTAQTPGRSLATVSGASVPVAGSPKVIFNKGCVNSEIVLVKNGGGNWGGISVNPTFVSNLTNSGTSFAANQDSVIVSYTSTGKKNIVIGSTTYTEYIEIKDNTRALPEIEDVVANIPSSICIGQSLVLKTPTNGIEYQWLIQNINTPTAPVTIATYTSKNPGTIVLNSPTYAVGNYQVKLRVKDVCCGWSVPTYREFSIINPPANPGVISGSNLVCFGSTSAYSVPSGGTGVTGYSWTTTIPGAVITPVGPGLAGNAVSVSFPIVTSSGQLKVKTLGVCGESIGESTLTINFKDLPQISIAPLTLCTGTSGSLTAGVTVAPPAYTYSWQPIGSISGANNGATINTTNLSSNTTYSVTVTSSNACQSTSNVTVNVLAPPAAPNLSSPTGITSTSFTANWTAVLGATTYFLDISTSPTFAGFVPGYNNLNVGNVLSFNATALSPSVTYYYRVRANNGACSGNSSIASSVTLNGLVWNGNISSDWFTPGNWTPNIVPNATSNITIPAGRPNYPVLTGLVTGFVRDVTVVSGASIQLVSPAEIEVNGDFNYSGTSLMGTGAIKMKGKQINAKITLGVLEINNSLNVDITSTSELFITEKLDLQNGQINIPSAAKVVLKSDATRTAYVDDFDDVTGNTNPGTGIIGNISIERYVPFVASGNAPYIYMNRYHYIGALTGGDASKWTASQFRLQVQGSIIDGVTTITPTPDCSETTLATGTAFSNLFTYNESKVTDCYLQGWEPRLPSAATPRGKGFAARINDASILIAPNRTLRETGAYSNTDLTISGLTITGTNLVDTTRGWHIVANPFWAPIDWTKVTGTNLDATAYRYDPETGNFLPINNIGFFGNTLSTNEAVYIRPLNNNTPGTYSITFPATARTNTENNEFLRQQQPYLYGLKIKVEANDESDRTFVLFSNNFTDGYDNGYDAGKMNSSVGVPTVYSRDLASNRSSILALPELTQQTTIPLGVRVQFDGQHVFTFEGVEDFPNTSIIWLEDLQTGAIQYLRDNNVYSFTANINDNADRFLLHFTPEMLISATDANCDNENGNINITERGGLEWTYTVTDAANNTITNGSVNGGQETVSQLPSGTYTLQLTNTISGYQTTETVTVNQVATVSAAISTQSTQVNVGDVVTVDISNTTGATNTSVDMGDGTVYNNESIINHSYTIGGNYTITVNANNDNCTDAASLQIMVMDVTTNIADAMSAEYINVTANRNELYIEQLIEKGTINAKVEIYNMLGQIVMITDINATYKQPYTIVLEDVARGTYIARVTAKGKMVSKRLLVSE